MSFHSMLYLFVFCNCIISDIQCSDRITAKTSIVTNSSKKKNVDLLQLINQERLIRFELDKNLRKISTKVEMFKIDHKLTSDQFDQEIQSINMTLSGLRKNQDETDKEVNKLVTSQISTDSEIGLLKEDIKSLKQKHKLDQKLTRDQFNLEIQSLNMTLSGLRKKIKMKLIKKLIKLGLIKPQQTVKIGRLKEEIKSFKKKLKIDQKKARDQFNHEIQSVNTTISGLRKKQDETNEEVNKVKTNQTSTYIEISRLKEDIKSLKQKHNIDQKLPSDQFNQKIQSLNMTLSGLRKNQHETNKEVNRVKYNQISTDSEMGLLKEEVKSFKQTQKIGQKLATDQFNQEILSINTTLKELRKKQDETNEEVNRFKTNQTSTDSLLKEIESMKQKLVQFENLITDLVKDKTENTLLKQEMESLKTSHKQLITNVTGSLKAKKLQIGFSAGLSSSKRSLSPGERIVYQHVISNIGNAYDAATGTFTAPKEGTYVFYFSTYPYHAGDKLYLDIVRNGNTIVRGRLIDRFYSDAVSNLALIHLTAGDMVWIKCYDGCDAGIWNLETSYASTFSGFML